MSFEDREKNLKVESLKYVYRISLLTRKMPSKDIILCESFVTLSFSKSPRPGPFSVPSARQGLPLNSGPDEELFIPSAFVCVSARLNDI